MGVARIGFYLEPELQVEPFTVLLNTPILAGIAGICFGLAGVAAITAPVAVQADRFWC